MHPHRRNLVPGVSNAWAQTLAVGAAAALAGRALRLAVAAEREGVVLAPGGTGRGMVVLGALAEATVALALGGEAARLAVLVDGVADPVDAGVAADGLVRGVDEDDLVVLVDTVLVDPVRVEATSQFWALGRQVRGFRPQSQYSHTEVSAALANTLLGSRLETTLELEVVDTLADGLTVGGTLGSAKMGQQMNNDSNRRLSPTHGFLRLPRRTRMR